ncbi:tryptophan synthase alpha chain [Buchnera aphidicola (Nipponaphis monzeni)]|uniref:Tryptophan synthase alpha chain n=1 Tax=Buchnera aphidicola (Nipponaphis monzeni) TaxID=2495405 RepID=A0A455TA76_9GAMM|nr:tryptophan synthase subunit alpha [Buchnera aphidicola]BBI01228.1 tryptophan synthase alpha chain [Buchnera aphidicola (Nipponaphis monzeni)]
MNRYQQLFRLLRKKKEGCLIPFLILGDPSINVSLKIIDNVIFSGADAIEIGIPFSDPLSDGPIIQESNIRAFKSGITLNQCFKMLNYIRLKHPMLPIGLLVYANIIFNYGIEQFYYRCAQSGVDSVLIADVPIEEYSAFKNKACHQKISSVFICPPNANIDLIKKISSYSNSYIYILSCAGVTGYKHIIQSNLKHFVHKFHQLASVPLIQGFGIHTPMQVKNVILSGMSGVICGSVIIRKIEQFYNKNLLMIKKINELIKILKNSTKKYNI